MTLSRTSKGPGSGTGQSCTHNCPLLCRTAALIVFGIDTSLMNCPLLRRTSRNSTCQGCRDAAQDIGYRQPICTNDSGLSNFLPQTRPILRKPSQGLALRLLRDEAVSYDGNY